MQNAAAVANVIQYRSLLRALQTADHSHHHGCEDGKMADDTDKSKQFLAPPAVVALRNSQPERGQMERTTSQDMREEREDLKEAAEHSMNVILDLGLDGIIRWASPSWRDVVGTSVESIQGKSITEIVVVDDGNSDVFSTAIESMKKDDSRSQLVRFKVFLGPLSILRHDSTAADIQAQQEGYQHDENEEDSEELINLEGQGIMVYDRASGGESHVRA